MDGTGYWDLIRDDFCAENRGQGKTELVSVEVESGEVKQLDSFHEPQGIVRKIVSPPTRDDKALYLEKSDLWDKSALLS